MPPCHGTTTSTGCPAVVSLPAARDPAAPRTAPPPDPPQRVVPTLPTPQETFGAIGRLIDQSIANVGAGVKGAGETLGATTDAAGGLAPGVAGAAGAAARPPPPHHAAGARHWPAA